MPLTPEQVQKYIKAGGVACPFCGSEEIEGDSYDHDVEVSQDIACLACGKEWRDIYSLAEISIDGIRQPSPEDPRDKALRSLVSTIGNTGGVDFDGVYHRPKVDPDWIDMGDAYIAACKALGVEPVAAGIDIGEVAP